MKISHVSSYVVGNYQRPLMAQGQKDLMEASYEASMGRVRDPGLKLGGRTGEYLDTKNQMSLLNSQIDMNNFAAQRMKTAQNAMNSLVYKGTKDGEFQGAFQLFNKAVTADPTVGTPKATVDAAKQAMDSLVSAMNSTYNGEYVFGGINRLEAPMQYYKTGDTDPTSASAKVQKAFEDHFGFPSTDKAQVATITPDDMEKFFNGADFDGLFTDPGWGDTFSKASSENAKNYISPNGEVVDTSVSANDQGFRTAMKTLVFAAEFADIGLSKDSASRVSTISTKGMGQASVDIALTQGELGTAEGRVTQATGRMQSQVDVLKTTENNLIGVDSAEASSRLIGIENMLNISYNLTSRISKLSLINYL